VLRLLEGIEHDTNLKVRSRAAAALKKILQLNELFVTQDVVGQKSPYVVDVDEDDDSHVAAAVGVVPLLSLVLRVLQECMSAQPVAVASHANAAAAASSEREFASLTCALIDVARRLLEVAPCSPTVQTLMTQHRTLLAELKVL